MERPPDVPPGGVGERVGGDAQRTEVTGSIRHGGANWSVLLAAVLAGAVGLAIWASLGGDDAPADAPPAAERPTTSVAPGEAAIDPASIPPSLVAAERFVAEPGPDTFAALIEAVGGLEAMRLGSVDGAFDLVRFDPTDNSRLLASLRSSYGRAENQRSNEVWRVGSQRITRTLLAPGTPHDFAHFNIDGSITLWRRSGESLDFAPRVASVLDNDGRPVDTMPPLYAPRFTAVAGRVFALTGDGDYYSNDRAYLELVAVDDTPVVLDAGESYGWIDNPTPELLAAYPVDASGGLALWDTETLEPLVDHPLAGRSYQRLAVSRDRRTALGVTFDGLLEHIDLTTGQVISRVGRLDPVGVDQPVALSDDGQVAVTVDRSGQVALWWVGVGEPVAVLDGDAAQPRWVSERYGALAASTVAPDASRVAVRRAATADRPVRWEVHDVSIQGLVGRACRLGGQPLTAAEREAVDLAPVPVACR